MIFVFAMSVIIRKFVILLCIFYFISDPYNPNNKCDQYPEVPLHFIYYYLLMTGKLLFNDIIEIIVKVLYNFLHK
jgi:hypothetical protein